MKWEEKYNAEEIAKSVIKEENTILKERLTQNASQTVKTDPHFEKLGHIPFGDQLFLTSHILPNLA